MIIAPLILLEAFFHGRYFQLLRPDIITSSCGTQFSMAGETFAGDIATLPPVPMEITFYLSITANVAAGVWFYRKNKGGYLLGVLSAINLFISVVAILSFISPYLYELPTHHCPFCILQREYGYIGYLLYGALFVSAVSGIGVGVLMPFRNISSLGKSLPSFQKRLSLASIVGAIIFAGVVTCEILFTDFVLQS